LPYFHRFLFGIKIFLIWFSDFDNSAATRLKYIEGILSSAKTQNAIDVVATFAATGKISS